MVENCRLKGNCVTFDDLLFTLCKEEAMTLGVFNTIFPLTYKATKTTYDLLLGTI